MDYVVPQFSTEEVDEAGRLLADPHFYPGNLAEAYRIAENWRAAHHYPLNGMSVVLKQRARRIHGQALVFQRLKRMPSILYKLRNRKWIKLSQMQDLGGCRAVLNSVKNVLAVRELYFDRPLTHEFKRETNYIERPKNDGYRGIHLIYFFVGSGAKAQQYAVRKMQIEIQVRTMLQHYWATAVETAETFTRQALKSSVDAGHLTGWKRFFALVSSCFALEEHQPQVPGTPDTMDETVRLLREIDGENHYCNHLETFKVTAEEISNRNKARFFLLDLDPEARRLRVVGFRPDASREANEAYTSKEMETQRSFFEDITGTQQVLVTVDDVAQLKRAYPNYYLDTTQFVNKVRNLIA